MYPGVFGEKTSTIKNIEKTIRRYLQLSARQLSRILKDVLPGENTEHITCQFIGSLAGIADCLEYDIKAAYEGDPAALSEKEIMLSYPAFEAISIYRLAHRLHELSVPLIPRMMTEYAHSITGIDIHPGAQIGRYFFIDHGTGVVIGETCTIGDHVKLYQGVTLGAKSFELDEHGNPIKGIKRHPDIGNHVVIYAGATILGGNTVIGDNCVIGGNVWLTHSVEAGKKIFYNNGE
ncbi:MAG: serine acetyltransferase [Eubacteriales bacterium]|nr:serine acetyltransferase [Eubacteriales bacterium]